MLSFSYCTQNYHFIFCTRSSMHACNASHTRRFVPHGRMAEWSKAVDSREFLFRALLGFGAFYSANAGVGSNPTSTKNLFCFVN
uniref:Secreted protein n=1 Tax=Panagrellus redivivus TaxID=6233 RepID=A0A7E4UM37_PANRE